MKKTGIFLVFLAVLAFSGLVWAQDPSTVPPPEIQQANSNSNQGVLFEHGDKSDVLNGVGGFSGGNSFGIGMAKDLCEPTANTTADGFATGKQTLGPDKAALSESTSTISSSFTTEGAKGTSGSIGGSSDQAVWAGVSSDEKNYANSVGNTIGSYNGSLASDTLSVSGMGLTQSTGAANVFVAQTDTTRSANALTVDRSTATTDILTGKTNVSGFGTINAQSFMENSGALALAGSNGNAIYGATGGSNIAGSLDVTGATKVEILPDSARASSATSSHAVITPCGPACP